MLLLRKNLRPCFSPLGIAFSSSVYRLLSAATPEAPPPTSLFAVQYLTNSFGLTSDQAIRASKRLPHLKSPDKPDVVLQFLRQAGITEPHIRAAAMRDPAFLCCNVEKCLKPRMAELKEMGFSPSQISLLLSICPTVFLLTKLKQKILFWMQIVGSVEKLLLLLRVNSALLAINPENSAVPNITFLEEQCSLSTRQIARVIEMAPRLITSRPEAVKTLAERAEQLGIPNSSGMFMYALIIVHCLNQSTIDAKVLCLRSHGFSQEEVTVMIRKQPFVLSISEELIGRKMEFLLKEAGYNKADVLQNPTMLTLSLEKRLIPRSLVQKLLKSKGLPVVRSNGFASFVVPSEKRFVEKFVLPYEHAIPGLHRAYIDSCSGKNAVMEMEKFMKFCS